MGSFIETGTTGLMQAKEVELSLGHVEFEVPTGEYPSECQQEVENIGRE